MIKQIDPRTLFVVIMAVGIFPILTTYSLEKIYLCIFLAILLSLFLGLVTLALKAFGIFILIGLVRISIDFIDAYAGFYSQTFAQILVLFVYPLDLCLMLAPTFIIGFILFHKVDTSLLIASLRKMKLPRGVVLSISVALRYLPTIKTEIIYIRESMAMRGLDFGIKNFVCRPLKTLEYALVPLLFRSLKIAEELSAAALTKGWEYQGKKSFYMDCRFTKMDLFTIVYILLGLIIIDRMPPLLTS